MKKPRAGSKRTAKDIAETKSQDQANAESTKAPTRRKRVKAPPASNEPEFFSDKRDMEDLWQAVFPVGTEWDQLDAVYQFKWNFSNLESAFEDNGLLHGKKVYLFGCTEPQLVPVNGLNKVICIPVVVAVVSPFPPSDKIGINSVQREAEEIIPMKQMKMDWVPYIPLAYRDDQVDRLKSKIFILSCTQRRAALRHLKIERVKKYEYCLPYFYQPLKEDEFENSTEVDIIFPAEPTPIICQFDWELDELEEFIDEKVKNEELLESQKDEFKRFIIEKVKEAKRANREAREARKKAVEEMSAETKAAYDNIRFYKFYPVPAPDTPDVSQVKVNLHGNFLLLKYLRLNIGTSSLRQGWKCSTIQIRALGVGYLPGQWHDVFQGLLLLVCFAIHLFIIISRNICQPVS